MIRKRSGPSRDARERETHRLLRELLSATRAHQAHVEKCAGLPAAAVRMLTVVGRHPRCTVGECAAHLGLSMPTVSNLLRELARRRWIGMVTDPADRRRVRLQLTAAGSTRIRRAIPFAGGMLPAVISTLSDPALAALAAGLNPLLSAVPPDYRSAAALRAPTAEAAPPAARRRARRERANMPSRGRAA